MYDRVTSTKLNHVSKLNPVEIQSGSGNLEFYGIEPIVYIFPQHSARSCGKPACHFLISFRELLNAEKYLFVVENGGVI